MSIAISTKSEKVPVTTERKRLNGHETRFIEVLVFAWSILHGDAGRVTDRLKMAGAVGDLKQILTRMEHLNDKLFATMTDSNLKNLNTLVHHGEMSVRVKPISKIPGYILIPEPAAKVLVSRAIHDQCTTCIKDCKEAGSCKLFNAISDCMPADDMDTMRCPYSYLTAEFLDGEM